MRFLVTIFAVCCAMSAQAATVVYTDRAAFEAALDNVTVDNLNSGLTNGVQPAVVDRGDYTIGGADDGATWGYGCVTSGCSNNSSLGFDYPSYLWNYNFATTQVVTFDTAVNGFGFDFSAPINQRPVNAIIEGITSVANAGFFGVISDVASTTWNYSLFGGNGFMLTDNITFGTTGNPAPVPVPASLPLLAFGLGAAAFVMRRKRSAS